MPFLLKITKFGALNGVPAKKVKTPPPWKGRGFYRYT